MSGRRVEQGAGSTHSAEIDRKLSSDRGRCVGDDPLLPHFKVAVFLADSNRTSTSAGGYLQAHSGQNLLPLFCDSIVRLYPNASFSILTTPTTSLPQLEFPTEIVARPIGTGPLLHERLRHYIAFLENAKDDCTYLFAESDMLMMERLRLDVTDDWDLAIAYKSTGMWINSGILLVRAHRRKPALAFLRRALEFYEKLHLNHQKWGSDQAAFRDALGLKEPPASPRVQVTGAARVFLFPRHELTRFAPWYACLFPPRAWILHFSGSRKKAMPYVHWLQIGRGAAFGRTLRNAVGRASVPG